MTGIWGWLATPGAAFAVGVLFVCLIVLRGRHKKADGTLARQRIGAVFVLSAITYTFSILALSELVFGGPHLSKMVETGFGDKRLAYLMVGVTSDHVLRIWSNFVDPE